MKGIYAFVIFLCCTCFLISCNVAPKAIIPGKDNCDFCKMTVSDPRYSAEILTQKGKVYIFDDLHCMIEFVKAKNIDRKIIKDFYVSDYMGSHELIKAKESYLFTGEELHSPMNGNTAAFANKDSMQSVMQELKGKPVNWNNLIQ